MHSEGGKERVLGRALTGHCHEAAIATKVGSDNLTPADLQRAYKYSLRLWWTDLTASLTRWESALAKKQPMGGKTVDSLTPL
jgi:aryl-alcohol dehydrogenase-like predicted oxidoreductase